MVIEGKREMRTHPFLVDQTDQRPDAIRHDVLPSPLSHALLIPNPPDPQPLSLSQLGLPASLRAGNIDSHAQFPPDGGTCRDPTIGGYAGFQHPRREVWVESGEVFRGKEAEEGVA